ncbi:MAG TPA: molybdopterin-dependent oxidoreductase [Xanthobacteraceae bacterium]|nr:molybdopterin-dependent oxidoreductase [Xanthobacteraceae bacterium]
MEKIPMDPADRTILREAPLDALRSFITPTSQHFVLAALGIPCPRPGEWSVRVGGAVTRRQVLSLEVLKALPSCTLTVTLECAGDPYAPDKPKRRVSTARWRGVPLEHVLALAEPLADATHVWIDGADWGVYLPGTKNAERVNEYRKDLPLERVRRGDVLLAYEMNDAPLPPEHGYPLRMVVPGFYGTNSVKWVNNLIVAHGRPYTLFSATLYNMAETVDGAIERRQVAEIQVNSLLTSLRNGDVISAGTHRLTGWAWGAHEIARVQLRVDEGPWFDAEVGPKTDAAWQAFESPWTVSRSGRYVISVRATDRIGNTQPEDVHINQIAAIEVNVT